MIENLYKFLPIILWLMYRSYVANKKTQQIPKSNPKSDKKKNPPSVYPSFDDVFQELIGENENSKTPSIELDEPKPSSHYEDNDSFTEVPESYEIANDFNSKKTEKPREDSIMLAKALEKESNDDFDLKSAIIAETILNRPEY